ncbi:MAG: hypothetical protein E6J40_08560 [Chloroflexi bacterium]|nr:MAG: hypothetical protein E6J40_08560 [Chloroflexota bacterium]
MRPLLTRGRIVTLSVLAVLVLLGTLLFVKPSAHEIHSPGATALNTQVAESDPPVYAYRAAASQSLENVRCEIWHTRDSRAACPTGAVLASTYFANLTQSPMTLYIPWTACSARGGGSDGFNVEYFPGTRTLNIHCYAAKPLISTEPIFRGVMAQPPTALLLVPTQSIPAGLVTIVEDVRTEHLLGDDNYEYKLGTATIS